MGVPLYILAPWTRNNACVFSDLRRGDDNPRHPGGEGKYVALSLFRHPAMIPGV